MSTMKAIFQIAGCGLFFAKVGFFCHILAMFLLNIPHICPEQMYCLSLIYIPSVGHRRAV